MSESNNNETIEFTCPVCGKQQFLYSTDKLSDDPIYCINCGNDVTNNC